MPQVVGTKTISKEKLEKMGRSPSISSNPNSISEEKTGAQILASPLAGGILFPDWNDDLPLSYSGIWGDLADMPCMPDLGQIGNFNSAYGLNQWNFFFTRRALWYRAIRAMRRDPTINLARLLSIAPALAAGWSYEDTDDAPEGAREWIEKELEQFRLHLIQTGMFGCIDFGWQSYEKVFEYRPESDGGDGKIHIKKLKPLLPDLTHIRVDQKNGEFIGLQQFQNFADIEKNSIVNLNLNESLLYYIDYEGTNWYGNSVTRIAEMPHRFAMATNHAALKYDLKIAGSHWVVSYPIGSSPFGPAGVETDNLIIANAIIQKLESSGAVAIPTMVASYVDDLNSVGGQFASEKRDWRVEIMSDNSAGAGSFDPRLRYLDSLKFRAYGLPERSGMEGQFGTKAEAGEHIDFALTHVETRHQFFCQHTNEQVVDHLLVLNWGRKAKGTVHVKPAPLTDASLAFLRQVYLKLLDLPSTEPQEVNAVDFKSLKKKLKIPTNPEYDAEDEDEDVEGLDNIDADKFNLENLDEVLATINSEYKSKNFRAASKSASSNGRTQPV